MGVTHLNVGERLEQVRLVRGDQFASMFWHLAVVVVVFVQSLFSDFTAYFKDSFDVHMQYMHAMYKNVTIRQKKN